MRTWDEATEKLGTETATKEKAHNGYAKRLIQDLQYHRQRLRDHLQHVSNRNTEQKIERVLSVTNSAGFVLAEDQFAHRIASASVPVRMEDFKKRGEAIVLYDGVEEWFERITEYGHSKGVRIDHFLVSSGNAEIIAGTPIASKFTQVYASKFMFNENGVADWPALAVNYTTKTQYLFRINKGAHDLSDNSQVNEFVEKRDRPVPFENIVFIGDGPRGGFITTC